MRLWFVPALCAGVASCVLLCAEDALAAPADCASSPTLEEFVGCLRSYMPTNTSGGFVSPSRAEVSAYRSVVRAMMRGECDFDPPAVLASLVDVRTFSDDESNREYCVLFETSDKNGDGRFDRGFGAFVVDPSAEREICHESPHPIADANTEIQAVSLFKWTASRSYLVAGAHRDTSTIPTSCMGDPASDVAHDMGNMFFVTNEVLREVYGQDTWWAIQWHGMSANTCPTSDVHLTHGIDTPPTHAAMITKLQSAMLDRHPSWRMTLAGSNKCDLDATDNVEGRLLNGVPRANVCALEPPSFSGRFLHIEQDPGFRDASDWIDAVEATFVATGHADPRTGLRKTPSPSMWTSTTSPP